MSTEEIPAELWLHIVQYLPWKSLHAVKGVNRMLYEVAIKRLLAVLDLTPRNVQNVESFIQRVELARSNPTAVKSLQVSPDFTQLPNDGEKTLGSLFSSLEICSPLRTKDAVKKLDSMVPCLVNLRKLTVIDRAKPNSTPMITSIPTWWTSLSSKLTVVVLQLSSESSFQTCLPTNYCPLPFLRTFRLHGRSRNVANCIEKISNLLSHSPLLDEIEWSFVEAQPNPNPKMLVSPYSASHPNLRVFRWTTSEGPGPIMPPYASSFSESLGMYFSSVLADFAPRIEVIHLCPCPPNDPQGLWSNLDFTKLTEIRVDLAFCQPYQYHDLFAFLNNSLCLATLELEGCYPLTDGSDQHPISLLPPIPSLKELYMPIDITALKPEVMEKLATKVSKLVKLVLRLEDSTSGYAFRKFMRLDNIISAFESADPFHGSWSLRDFGVVKTDTKRAHFGKLVHAVAKKFPSIASFYGSGKLEVPSESLGEKEWSGKLDEMKVSNASHAIEEMRWHAQQELEFWACM